MISRGKILNNLLLALIFGIGWNVQKAEAKLAEVLFGGAAVTAAIGVPVVSAIQADGQVKQARTRANAATLISQINAQTAVFQARTQSYVAQAQAGVQRAIAAFTQQSQTRDLLAQLQFMAYNRALDNQIQQQQLAAQIQNQNNLLALEYKKMELNQILAQTQALGGAVSPLQIPPSGQGTGGSILSPIAQTLQGGGGAQSSATNSPASSNLPPAGGVNQNSFSASSSSLGIKRALGRSISNGSTVARRRVVESDLSQMLGSAPRRPPSLQEATYSRRAIRAVASQTH